MGHYPFFLFGSTYAYEDDCSSAFIYGAGYVAVLFLIVFKTIARRECADHYVALHSGVDSAHGLLSDAFGCTEQKNAAVRIVAVVFIIGCKETASRNGLAERPVGKPRAQLQHSRIAYHPLGCAIGFVETSVCLEFYEMIDIGRDKHSVAQRSKELIASSIEHINVKNPYLFHFKCLP